MNLIENLGIAAIPVIVIIVFVAVEGVKATGLDNKWLPAIAGGFGGILGIIGYFVMTDFPATDLLTAFAYGVVSGLAATGAHQVYKQLLSGDKEPIGTLSVNKDDETIDWNFDVDPLDFSDGKTTAQVKIDIYKGKHIASDGEFDE